MFQVRADELLVTRRFGPLEPGVNRREVREALGAPDSVSAPGVLTEGMAIDVYGRTLCRGHLEFHYLEERLWMIFADYLPLRRYRSARLAFDPGCLGGLTLPSIAEVVRAVPTMPPPRAEPLRGIQRIDPALTASPRVPVREWAKAVKRAAAMNEDEAVGERILWPSGAALVIGCRWAELPAGGRLVSEDVVFSVSVPMLADE